MFRSLSSSLAIVLAAILIAAPAHAQQREFEPEIGQAGKDVIWVPTPDDVVERMLRMAQTTSRDYVIDLGAGDGKIAIAAAKKFGARALGIEYDPDMVKYAQAAAQKAGVTDKARIIQGDIFTTDFSQATVLTLYLLPTLNLRLRPQILVMRPGTRVVSHSFTMGDWEPDEVSVIEDRQMYLWIVPVNVMGSWVMERNDNSGEKTILTLMQRYQRLEGTAQLGRVVQAGLRETWLRGTSIGFSYVDNSGVRREFAGRMSDNRIEGSYRAEGGTEGRWTAIRK